MERDPKDKQNEEPPKGIRVINLETNEESYVLPDTSEMDQLIESMTKQDPEWD